MIVSDAGNFEQVPEGTYTAVLVKQIDLGTQTATYKDEEKKRHQVWFQWELHGEHKMDDGSPFTVSKFYTASLGEKANLRKDLQAWRGRAFSKEELKGFDLRTVLGKSCMMNIVINEKDRPEITAIMKLPANMQHPIPTSDLLYISFQEFNPFDFELVPNGIKAIAEKSPEYQAIVNGLPPEKAAQPQQQTTEELVDDEIPF